MSAKCQTRKSRLGATRDDNLTGRIDVVDLNTVFAIFSPMVTISAMICSLR